MRALLALAVAGVLPLSGSHSAAAAQQRHSTIQLDQQNTAPVIAGSYRQAATRSSRVAAPSVLPLARSAEAPASSLRLALWGGAGMLTGLALGAYLGEEIACNPRCVGGDDPGLREATLGAGIGMTVVTPLAVHLANSRRGSVAASLAASALLTGFWFLGSAIDPPQGWATTVFVVGPPIAQIATSVLIERSTSGRHEDDEF